MEKRGIGRKIKREEVRGRKGRKSEGGGESKKERVRKRDKETGRKGEGERRREREGGRKGVKACEEGKVWRRE